MALPLFLIVFGTYSFIAAATTLRGVDPALASDYSSSHREFSCRDGLRTLSFSQVNDGYCDCYDGSDEPGIFACFKVVYHASFM